MLKVIEEIIKSSTSHSLPKELSQKCFAHGLWPWIEVARKRLQEMIKDPLADLFPEALFLLESELLRRWIEFCTPSFVLEMKVIDMEKPLQGKTAEERYLNFVQRFFGDPKRLRHFFDEYKKLGSAIETMLLLWVDATAEFLVRLHDDLPLLAKIFNEEKALGKVCSITGNISDYHLGGRSALLLKFETGLELLYKPKDLKCAQEFYQLVESINGLGLSPKLKKYKIIARDGYGWEEKVEHLPCHTLGQVARFYERTGMYLCLLYLLDGSDIHYENIIASCEDPFLIDLEALFSVFLTDPSKKKEDEIFKHSVSRTGLLPQFQLIPRQGKGKDLSGLTSAEEFFYDAPIWKRINTDEIHLVLERVYFNHDSHRVIYQEKKVAAHQYIEEIIQGFRKMYTLIQAHRSHFLGQKGWVSRLAEYRVRFVIRATRFYSHLFHRLSSPRNILDDEMWEKPFEDLHRIDSRYISLFEEEKASLIRGDIPCFHTIPKQHHLYMKEKLLLVDCLEESSFERVTKRIERMDQNDLSLQESFIRQSFNAVTTSIHSKEISVKTLKPQQKKIDAVDESEVIEEVKAIAKELLKSAHRTQEGRLIWFGLIPDLAQEQLAAGPINYSLYSGKMGVAIFFGALSSFLNNDEWRKEALNVLSELREEIRSEEVKSLVTQYGLGGMAGVGGLIYGLCTLSKILKMPELIEDAKKLAEAVEQKQIDADRDFDLVLGSAGLLLALLRLLQFEKTPHILDLAKKCGDHLCAHAPEQKTGVGWKRPDQPALLGFSHGTAGIVYALLQLADATQNDRYLPTVNRALSYERSQFCHKHQNWPHLGTSYGHVCYANWCHGAIGVGFSRLGFPSSFQNQESEKEIKNALGHAEEHLLNYDLFCLCCGSFGRFELLLEASRRYPQLKSQRDVQSALENLWDHYQHEKGGTNRMGELNDPSFMRGKAGIGYTFLRYLDKNETLPQILLFS